MVMGVVWSMRFIFIFMREYTVQHCKVHVQRDQLTNYTTICRYNQGDIVLGMEFGDHVGDW